MEDEPAVILVPDSAKSISPPNRASVYRNSPWYYRRCSEIQVLIDGVVHTNDVSEYCVEQGWAKLANGEEVKGHIQPQWKPTNRLVEQRSQSSHQVALSKAEAKRQRKAEVARRNQERSSKTSQ